MLIKIDRASMLGEATALKSRGIGARPIRLLFSMGCD